MSKTLVPVLLTIGVLAGCVGAEITQPPVQYVATKKLNEKGVNDFTARTFVRTDGGIKELSGVPCEFAAPGFGAKFLTPAVVATPDMGPRTPTASITCKYNEKTKLEILKPVNLTITEIEQSANAAGAGAGLIGVIVSGISASSQKSRRDANLDRYGYLDVVVVIK